jgi:hypothetical protein
MGLIKLNVGASPIWEKKGWHTLDHKVREESEYSFGGDAAAIPVSDSSCETVFCSHMFEHIPHTRLESILLEFNRVLSSDGVLRVLMPDLKKVAEAYVQGDTDFFREARDEDESLRTDLGLGGMFMNFIVSPGQDTALMNRGLDQFIAGYAHLYSYDFEMMKILLERTGFGNVQQMGFCESSYDDYEEPLHIKGLEPVWENFNQAFYEKNNLVHHYDEKSGRYEINFKVTGFDRDPLTSLIVEANKDRHIDANNYKSLNNSKKNYNRYAWSLLRDPSFSKRLGEVVRSAEPEK